MEKQINQIIGDHNLTIMTGDINTGKSWIVSRLEGFHIVNKKNAALRGESTELNGDELNELSSSSLIAIDEAQIMDVYQMTAIMNNVLSEGKKLVLVTQNINNLKYLDPFNKTLLKKCQFAHIELGGWDKEISIVNLYIGTAYSTKNWKDRNAGKFYDGLKESVGHIASQENIEFNVRHCS